MAQKDISLFEWPGDVGIEIDNWELVDGRWEITGKKISYPAKGTVWGDFTYLMEPPSTLGSLLVKLEIFPSKSEARRQGWDREFPIGWAEIKIGHHIISIWNPTQDWSNDEVQDT